MGKPILEVCDHEIRLYYTTEKNSWNDDCIGSGNWPFSDLSREELVYGGGGSKPQKKYFARPWVPPEAEEVFTRKKGANFWKMTAKGAASPDIYQCARGLINGQDTDRVQRFALNAQDVVLKRSVDVMMGRSDNVGDPDLHCELSNSAKDTLNKIGYASTSVPLSIINQQIYKFRSGVSILELTVQLKVEEIDEKEDLDSDIQHVDILDRKEKKQSISAELLQEVVYSLSRKSKLFWSYQNSSELHAQYFSLGDIARTLLEGAEMEVRDQARVFSSVFCKVDHEFKTDGEMEIFATKLAKRYNSRVELGKLGDVIRSSSQSLKNIHRAVCPEGCAVVVERSDAPHIQNYRTNSWAGAYAPLALLSLHEQEALTSLLSKAAVWLDLDPILEGTTNDISKIRNSALQLRTAYSFPRVSRIADHDEWKSQLEKQMRVRELRDSVAEELHSTEVILRESLELDRAAKLMVCPI